MKKILGLFLFLSVLIGCAQNGGSGGNSSANTTSYFSYEQYDFINNIYVPYTQLFFSENGSFFFIQKVGCDNMTYQISSKTYTGYDVHYTLTSPTIVTNNSCFQSSMQIDLTYMSNASNKNYYQSSLFGQQIHFYRPLSL